MIKMKEVLLIIKLRTKLISPSCEGTKMKIPQPRDNQRMSFGVGRGVGVGEGSEKVFL